MPRICSKCLRTFRASKAKPPCFRSARRYPHEMRAADYGDCVTETTAADGKKLHGLNGDILVWNHATRRRNELSSMGIRVNVETLKKQLEMSGQTDFLKFLYDQ